MTIMLDANHMRSATVYRKNYSTICVDMPREVRTLGIAHMPSPHIKHNYDNKVIKCQPTYAKCIINEMPDQPDKMCYICKTTTILHMYKHYLLRFNIIRQMMN